MTVKEFIVENPNATLDMMTPRGFVYLTPEKAQELLAGESVMSNPGCSGFDMAITAEELLGQTVENANFSDGAWHLLTAMAQEQSQGSSGWEQGVTMC